MLSFYCIQQFTRGKDMDNTGVAKSKLGFVRTPLKFLQDVYRKNCKLDPEIYLRHRKRLSASTSHSFVFQPYAQRVVIFTFSFLMRFILERDGIPPEVIRGCRLSHFSQDLFLRLRFFMNVMYCSPVHLTPLIQPAKSSSRVNNKNKNKKIHLE